MWGKWAQNHNKTQTTIVDSEKEFYELLSTSTEITNLIIPNNEVAWVSCKYSENNVAKRKNDYVAVAAYVRAQAVHKRYDYLNKL